MTLLCQREHYMPQQMAQMDEGAENAPPRIEKEYKAK
jgi:hypothetical protein